MDFSLSILKFSKYEIYIQIPGNSGVSIGTYMHQCYGPLRFMAW